MDDERLEEPGARAGEDGPVIAHIALGSNLGDRERHLEFAIAELDATDGVEVLCVSSVYETDPVGDAPQGPYLNAVAEVRTSLEPVTLLARLLAIEAEAGRARGADDIRWGPRTLDLDLLLYGDACIDLPDLTIPHPRLHERAFVLMPLCELVPDRPHPVLGRPIRDYEAQQHDPQSVRKSSRRLSIPARRAARPSDSP